MMMDYLIGIDLGTQGVKAAVYEATGKCLGTAFRKSNLYQRGGIAKEDPEEQLANLVAGLLEVMSITGIPPGRIAAMAVAGQMAGIVGVDKAGMHATYYDSWLDTRCAPYMKSMMEEAGDEVAGKTGSYPSYNHGPKILWWMNEHPDIYKQVTSFVQPAAYLAMRLCGLTAEQSFIDRTYVHFSGFADNRANEWCTELCVRFGVDSQKLPQIVEPDAIVGYLTKNMAARCGLISGVPVVAGCGDTAASFLSAGATRPGICVDVAGTASVFATTTTEMVSDTVSKTLACGQSVIKGLWHPYAYLNGGGMNIEWWQNSVVNTFGGAQPIRVDELDKMASTLDAGDQDPMFLPYLGGRVCPAQPEIRGGWFNVDWSHNASSLYRAILESVALEYGYYLSVLEKIAPRFSADEVRITGGGGKSDLWNQIKADALQLPVIRSDMRQEGAAMGAAMVAGKGVGLLTDLDSAARSWSTSGDVFQPRASKKALYERKLKLYVSITELLTTNKSVKLFNYA